MKKLIRTTLILFLLIGGIFLKLVSQATPENAPQETVTIDLPDIYEK